MKTLLLALLMLVPLSAARAQNFVAVPFQLQSGNPADATQVMADLNSLVANGNAALTALNAQLAAKGVGLPIYSGTVAPFYLNTCPSGWFDVGDSSFAGNFIRGAGGGYTLGQFAAFQMAQHYHAFTGSFAVTANNANRENSGGSAITAINGLGATGFATSGNMNTGSAGGETRPRNVNLLYCQKS